MFPLWAAAGLAVGSAAALFVAPPVGIGLGLAAAATGGMTTAADLSEDSSALPIRSCPILSFPTLSYRALRALFIRPSGTLRALEGP